MLVLEKEILHRVICHNEIDPAIIVRVHRRNGQRLGHRPASGGIFYLNACGFGNIREFSLAVVAIQHRECALEVHRRPISPPDAHQLVIDFEINFPRPAHIIADKQIQIAVVVAIDPRRARAPVRSRVQPNIAKTSAALVVKQFALADTCDENVRQTIVVIIPDRCAHPVEAHIESRTTGYVRKLSFAIVAIQPMRRASRRFRPRPIGRVHEQQIFVAVVVEVEERHASAHRLRQQLFASRAVVMHKLNARLFCDVHKSRYRNFRQRRGSDLWRAQRRHLRGRGFAARLRIPKPRTTHHYEHSQGYQRPPDRLLQHLLVIPLHFWPLMRGSVGLNAHVERLSLSVDSRNFQCKR